MDQSERRFLKHYFETLPELQVDQNHCRVLFEDFIPLSTSSSKWNLIGWPMRNGNDNGPYCQCRIYHKIEQIIVFDIFELFWRWIIWEKFQNLLCTFSKKSFWQFLKNELDSDWLKMFLQWFLYECSQLKFHKLWNRFEITFLIFIFWPIRISLNFKTDQSNSVKRDQSAGSK